MALSPLSVLYVALRRRDGGDSIGSLGVFYGTPLWDDWSTPETGGTAETGVRV